MPRSTSIVSLSPSGSIVTMAHIGQVIENPLSGERIVFRQTAAHTGGRLLAFDLYLAPGGRVPSSHAHPEQEERFTVVRGRMRFRVAGRTVIARAGDTTVVPPGTVHAFSNPGVDPAQVRVEVRPALHMEDLLETATALARDGRTLPNHMPRPLDLVLFLSEFRQEVRPPIVPAALMQALVEPLAWLVRRLGRDAAYRAVRQRLRGSTSRPVNGEVA